MAIASQNPATGEVLAQFPRLSATEQCAAVQRAATTFLDYRQTRFSQRSQWLQQLSQIFLDQRDDFAQLMSLEMGKPISQARAEVEKCGLGCRWYAEQGAAALADRPEQTDARRSFVRYQPLGVVLGIMPWNFPFWQVVRFAAPTLMAGNTALLKHASNVPQSALALEQLFREAGFPSGVFQTLLIPGSDVPQLLADQRIRAVSLTGSTAVGREVAAAAGRSLKKSVLELGGSDPFIVMASADLDRAVDVAVTARLQNNGQSCIAAKRFILQEAIAQAFTDRLLARYQALKVGDPLDENTDVGPLATAAIHDDLVRQVEACKTAGATVLWGGQSLRGSESLPEQFRPGFFYAPTLIEGLDPTAAIAQEELFGPVALLYRVADLAEAIALANDTPFGLGASAWTQDPQEQEQLVNELAAGSVFINDMVKSDPRLPFGGIKDSGYGRELSLEGIREFVNIKTIWIR
jgi:succinate-semialdehyde dehydrogenase / glutarate-semialdehyde dehydrogenase